MKAAACFVALLLPLLFISACGSGGSSSTNPPPTGSFTLKPSVSTLSIAQGANGTVTITITDVSPFAGSVNLAATGLPTGVTASFATNPAASASVLTLTASSSATAGSSTVTITGTASSLSASTTIALTVTTSASQIPTTWSWTSTGPLISPASDSHDIIAVKDPSTVYYNGQYLVYASTVNSSGDYGMEYVHFADWSDAPAASASPYYLDYLGGTAPQVFFFAPQNKWYLIYQWTPQFSTNSDPTQPQNWTAPQNFYASKPSNISAWLDFWIICDSGNCYLFFCDDGGHFWEASTPIGDFPNGFGTPVLAYSEANQNNLFEADNVYTVKQTGTYLADVECIGGPDGHRFFRALTATSLAGPWTPLGNTLNFDTPFLGTENITTWTNGSQWTDDISSGGGVITGGDQTDTVDLSNFTFLYQGDAPNNGAGNYNAIPWQLGLATSNSN